VLDPRPFVSLLTTTPPSHKVTSYLNQRADEALEASVVLLVTAALRSRLLGAVASCARTGSPGLADCATCARAGPRLGHGAPAATA